MTSMLARFEGVCWRELAPRGIPKDWAQKSIEGLSIAFVVTYPFHYGDENADLRMPPGTVGRDCAFGLVYGAGSEFP